MSGTVLSYLVLDLEMSLWIKGGSFSDRCKYVGDRALLRHWGTGEDFLCPVPSRSGCPTG